ncbi:hypothetical protein LRB11_13415 [Ectothiorhodospira haloalkaliphila]|uniref:hypothetical protein n=1 Tax=Ectothiorhodospira haloalkaliphila TaxID=421628 RepID=UPI001EE96822|nr:hypothetical protein [Ectothiorhodospira haloalkaliphila]MCG5525919.1 hypothetical protein [Ectothiorhodospira haloalkaliphila]
MGETFIGMLVMAGFIGFIIWKNRGKEKNRKRLMTCIVRSGGQKEKKTADRAPRLSVQIVGIAGMKGTMMMTDETLGRGVGPVLVKSVI